MPKVVQESTGNGTLRLTVEDGNMIVSASYQGGGAATFSESVIYRLLNEAEVKYGIDESAIQRLTDSIRTLQNRQKLDETLATGMAATESVDGRVEYLITEDLDIRETAEGRTDFRNIHRYKVVEPGQVLVRVFPAVHGKEGINVLGEVVAPKEPTQPNITTGSHIGSRSGDSNSTEYFAAVKGIYVHLENQISVTPELIIEGNAGLETGNLSYDLTIQVHGNIERGTEIVSGKDLIVQGLIESGDIKVTGSIEVTGGINAGGKGKITCGGNLITDFIENSHIICDGSIQVSRSILSSTVVSHGRVDFTDTQNSIIAGGEIIHFSDLKVSRIGNQNEIRTVIYPGVHFHNQQIFQNLRNEVQELEKKIKALSEYLTKLKELLVVNPTAKLTVAQKKEAQERVQIYHQIKSAIEKKKEIFSVVQHSRRNDAPVKVYVNGVIMPGTEFHYRGTVEKIPAPINKVILTFSPERDSPKYEPHPD
ncbi:MAG: DUF342 domain-containing protein [Leptonema sp. (in: Bacteria)]|nr:DUF342 domain-containing protein [Leptonema sp. (in: bacteria)]